MKRIISLLLCILMISSMAAMSVSAFDIKVDQRYTVGDANDDGTIDMQDSLEIKKASAGIGEVNLDGADINCDGIVNAKDLLISKKCNADIDSIANYDSESTIDCFAIGGVSVEEFCIVVPEWATEEHNILYAANRFSLLLSKATGFAPEIFWGEMGEGYSHAINFCDVPAGSELEEKLFIENYIYEVVDGNLNIYGTRRGNMYAIYDIATEYLGFRFYLRSYAYEYADRYANIPEGTRVYREPAMTFRNGGVGADGGVGSEMHELNLLGRKMNGIQSGGHYHEDKYGTVTGPHFINAHSYGYYWKMGTGMVDVYFDGTNNNDYAEKYEAGIQQDEYKWNPCFTDDKVYGVLFRGLLETMRYMQDWDYYIDHKIREHTSAMSFSICDNVEFCSCNGCRYVSSEGTDRDKGERLNSGGSGLCVWLANRACRDIKEYYPGRAASMEEYGDGEYSEYGYGEAITDAYPTMKIYTIIYTHVPPNKVLPEENLIIMYCGVSCNNHFIGSGECGDRRNNLGHHCQTSVDSLKGWGQACKDAGAEMWFWYYPVNYNMKLVDTPNVFNVYHDFKYMVTECNVTGVYFESATGGNVFEPLKGHLAALMMNDFYYDEEGNLHFMSEAEFHEAIKEYLMMHYGAGYEYIYDFIVWMDEAGNEAPCFINNFDRPGDMFDYEYVRDNYEEGREYILKALALAETAYEIDKIEKILICCDFLGLSANYKNYYVNGTEETIAVYTERYINMYNMIKDKGIRIFGGTAYTLPEVVDITVSPMESFYEAGSWNIANKDTWGYMPNNYGWGYGGVIQ